MREGKADNRISRVLAISLALMLCLMACVSYLYLGLESGHHCEEDECPVCRCIQICEGLIHRIGSGVSLQTLPALFIVLILTVNAVINSNNPMDTLVSRKIRLND